MSERAPLLKTKKRLENQFSLRRQRRATDNGNIICIVILYLNAKQYKMVYECDMQNQKCLLNLF